MSALLEVQTRVYYLGRTQSRLFLSCYAQYLLASIKVSLIHNYICSFPLCSLAYHSFEARFVSLLSGRARTCLFYYFLQVVAMLHRYSCDIPFPAVFSYSAKHELELASTIDTGQ
jgi:hypothetical protein